MPWAGVAVAILKQGVTGNQLTSVTLGFFWFENEKSHIVGNPSDPGRLTQLVTLAGDTEKPPLWAG